MELFDVNQIPNVADPQVAFPDTLATVSMTKASKEDDEYISSDEEEAEHDSMARGVCSKHTWRSFSL
jgi:hypothetical protein